MLVTDPYVAASLQSELEASESHLKYSPPPSIDRVT